MAVVNYLKRAFRLTSLIFTILVTLNLVIQKHVLFNVIEYILVISAISGLLLFLVDDNGSYSNRRLLINQISYICLIFSLIILGNYLYHWELGVKGLLTNFIVVILIYFFIKFIMFSSDKKEAQAMNDYIEQRKQDKF